MLATALHFSHSLLKETVQPGNHVVDATMGNGNDTELLAELVGKTGKVYAFDIQEQALRNTQDRLTKRQLPSRVKLILDGHEHLGNYLETTEEIHAAIFNLGYLPKSDKQVITLPATTQQALDTLLQHLAHRGRIIIVAYYGHPGGEEELTTVRDYCSKLPQKEYNVLNYQFINQQNQPPILFCIEKK
ncbi:class I SAM-dependent methyltransferase [Enterococcus olivae]